MSFLDISNNIRMGSIEIDCSFKERTWAEKQRDKFIFNMKSKKANLNKFIVFFLTLLFSIAAITIAVVLSVIVKSVITSIMIGIVNGKLILLCYYYLTSKFECDVMYITVTHKGKSY
jgi:uncharacterized membrane-anchored protein